MTPSGNVWHDAGASEMRPAVAWDRPSTRSRGAAAWCVGWLVDRPSKRRSGARDAAKSRLRDPAGSVDGPIQAPGGRRRRPSRAFFVPPRDTGHRPTGASLDALLLLPHLGRSPLRGRRRWLCERAGRESRARRHRARAVARDGLRISGRKGACIGVLPIPGAPAADNNAGPERNALRSAALPTTSLPPVAIA